MFLKHIPEVAKLVTIISLCSKCLLASHNLNWKSLDATSRHLDSFKKTEIAFSTWTISHAAITVMSVTENYIYGRACSVWEGDVSVFHRSRQGYQHLKSTVLVSHKSCF